MADQTAEMSSQLAEAKRARETTVLLDIARRWDEPQLIKARLACYRIGAEDFPNVFLKAKEDVSKHFFVYQMIPNFFEDIGRLVAKEIVTIEDVSESIGNSVAYWWTYFGPAAQPYDHDMDRVTQTRREPVYKNFRALAQRVEDFRGSARA
jgi:hypothetical protein